MAYQYNDGTYGLYYFPSGAGTAKVWYTGGLYNLTKVAGRLVLGGW